MYYIPFTIPLLITYKYWLWSRWASISALPLCSNTV